MLLCEHLGRDHEGALVAALHAVEETGEGNDGLAGTDVSLQEPVHGMGGGEILRHLQDRPLLSSRSARRAGGRGTPPPGSPCRAA